MLRTVDLVYEDGVPVLGVNVGQLGYLTEVEPDRLEAPSRGCSRGDFDVDERMMLEVDRRVAPAASPDGGGR